ncbi:MAG: hypothetical protein HRT45_01950 [Bdellovibrionales bacterium]|nr:hypothetical protein [Bdellovibrionales bacterium]
MSMKVILKFLKIVRHVSCTAVAIMVISQGSAMAEAPEDFTAQVRGWSQGLSIEQRTAISHELVSTLDQQEQFVTLDGLPKMLRLADYFLGTTDPSSPSNIMLVINAFSVDKEDSGQMVQFVIPKFMTGEVDHLEPVTVNYFEDEESATE